jgi:hypothetical protein
MKKLNLLNVTERDLVNLGVEGSKASLDRMLKRMWAGKPVNFRDRDEIREEFKALLRE